MRILLDTNIIIHREANKVINKDIGLLFNWLDKLHYEKCVHPETINEIRKHQSDSVVSTFETKIKNYQELKTLAPESEEISRIRDKHDTNANDQIDTSLLNEVYSKRVDFLITEDRKIHEKSAFLSIPEKVFTINSFLEKVTTENPELCDYKVLSVKKEYFGNIELNDHFFDSFREDYKGFNSWFNKKSDEISYVCKSDNGEIVAFLYLKKEEENENYSDIYPPFKPAKRLKIGTLKVASNGYKIGERFLKIIFDNAISFGVDEIYVTLFNHNIEQNILYALLSDWGFIEYGKKETSSGTEIVLTREFTPKIDIHNPRYSYPYISNKSEKFIVSIYPEYHTELFPDSILNTESPLNFIENKPNRNAIRKVYISRAINRNMKSGDIIVFYRTAPKGEIAKYRSVTTTIGVVQSVITDIDSEERFLELCRKRSVFSEKELLKHWNHKKTRPFIVNFLYVYSFPKRMNLDALIHAGVIKSVYGAPRGFDKITNEQFSSIMDGSNANYRIIVD